MENQVPVIEVDNEAAAGFAYIGSEEALDAAIKAQRIQKLRKSIKGAFNKEVLYATKFTDTDIFSAAAIHKKKYGTYTNASFGSKVYREYWREQGHRALHGYRNPKTGVWITGYHYFFLNFKQLEIVDDPYAPVSTKSTSFPRFWAIHWHFFMAIQEAEENGKHLCLLKPRGTGFSELFSSMGARDYTMQRRKKSFYFAAHKDYLLGEGIVQKVWDNMEYLNQNTERGFKRLRQKKDTDFHKRASEVTRKGDEVWKGGEVFARIIDNPNKARGARGYKIYYEEGGSFPKVDKAWNICRPLVEQGGVATGTMILWGCVCAGTKVWDGNGKLVNIEDIQQVDGILSYDGEDVGYEYIEGLKPTIEKPCYRITTENGNIIECSYDHPLLWSKEKWRSHGILKERKIGFIKAEEVKEGDYLFTPNKVNIFGAKNKEHARLLGLLIGDGNYSDLKYRISLSVNDKEIEDFINEYYPSAISYREKKNKHSDNYHKDYTFKPLAYFRQVLQEADIMGQSKEAKRLPANIHIYNKQSVAELLAGYFDADGSVKYNRKKGGSVVLTSISEELLKEVKYQLIKFGIHCSILEENPKGGFGDKANQRHKIYRLYINRGNSIKNFYLNIPISIKSKIVNLMSAVGHTSKTIGTVKKAKYIHNEHYYKGDYFINKEFQDLEVFRVKKVEFIGEKKVYNLTTSDTHTYLANNFITGNTGGEQGPGIAGLEDIFRHPRAYNCLEFDNCWEEDQGGKPHGFFFPVEACMDRFMDKDGNPDFEAGKAFHLMERATIREDKPEKEDAYIAEYCMTPTEALLRLASNHFPIAELQRQRLRVTNNKGIQGFLKYGDIVRDGGTGKFKFQIHPNGRKRAMQEYPHDQAGDLSGCVTMIESPYTDQLGHVPSNMYYVIVDPFYKDEAEDKTSLGAAYVYKAANNFSASEGDIIVAWYVGRPRTTDKFHKTVFDLARFYGATIQSEIAGGGKGLYDYAKVNKLLHLCELEPSLMFNKSVEVKETSKSYFMNMSAERVTQALTYLADWLLVERSITSDDSGKTITVLNLNKIYDVGLLDELIKFSDDGNFDRISAMRLLPFMIKEKHEVEIQRNSKKKSDYWNRTFHSGVTNYDSNSLPMDEMKMDD